MRLTRSNTFRSVNSNHSVAPPVTKRLLVRLRGALSRKVIGLAVVFSLVMLPALGLAQKASLLSSLNTTGPVRVVSKLFNMLFGTQEAPPEDASDRIAQVRTIRLSPSRFVAYPGGSLTFQAIGLNFAGEIVQGVVFDNWESSDSASVQVDDSGRARFLSPGLTTITCRAGAASERASHCTATRECGRVTATRSLSARSAGFHSADSRWALGVSSHMVLHRARTSCSWTRMERFTISARATPTPARRIRLRT